MCVCVCVCSTSIPLVCVRGLFERGRLQRDLKRCSFYEGCSVLSSFGSRGAQNAFPLSMRKHVINGLTKVECNGAVCLCVNL